MKTFKQWLEEVEDQFATKVPGQVDPNKGAQIKQLVSNMSPEIQNIVMSMVQDNDPGRVAKWEQDLKTAYDVIQKIRSWKDRGLVNLKHYYNQPASQQP